MKQSEPQWNDSEQQWLLSENQWLNSDWQWMTSESEFCPNFTSDRISPGYSVLLYCKTNLRKFCSLMLEKHSYFKKRKLFNKGRSVRGGGGRAWGARALSQPQVWALRGHSHRELPKCFDTYNVIHSYQLKQIFLKTNKIIITVTYIF